MRSPHLVDTVLKRFLFTEADAIAPFLNEVSPWRIITGDSPDEANTAKIRRIKRHTIREQRRKSINFDGFAVIHRLNVFYVGMGTEEHR